jgi:hypothetical protein
MNVERKRRQPLQRLDDLGAKGQVWHEPAVHHVDMNPVRAAILAPGDVVGQPAEVGTENRGGDANAHGLPETRMEMRSAAVTGEPATGI